MKKVKASDYIAAVMLALSITACGGQSTNNSASPAPAQQAGLYSFSSVLGGAAWYQAPSSSIFSALRAITTDATGNVYVVQGDDSIPNTLGTSILRLSPSGASSKIFSQPASPPIWAIDIASAPSGMLYLLTLPQQVGTGSETVGDLSLIALDPLSGKTTTITGANVAPPTGSEVLHLYPSPSNLTVASDGNAYVAYPTQIQRISPTGFITTIAANSQNTSSAAPVFSQITGITAGIKNDVFVADQIGDYSNPDNGNTVIRHVAADGQVTAVAGGASGNTPVDGKGTAAHFRNIAAMAADHSGNLYVVDSADSPYCSAHPGAAAYLIRKIAPDGTVRILAGTAGEGGITLKPQSCGGPRIAFAEPNILYLIDGTVIDKLVLP